ncbi:hypothetical protein NL676_025408 [Syzygium grande]|nr:hypothetical protein NL676_025408 [Syzygium grande]
MVSRDVVFNESDMVKANNNSHADGKSEEGSTVQVDSGEPEIEGGRESSSNSPKSQETVEDTYTIAEGRGKRTHKAPVRYGFEDMVAYALTKRVL